MKRILISCLGGERRRDVGFVAVHFLSKKPEDPQQKPLAQKSLSGLLKSFTGWVFHIARYRQPPIYTNMNHRNHPTGRWFLKFLDPTGSTEHQPFMDRWIYHTHGTYCVKAVAFISGVEALRIPKDHKVLTDLEIRHPLHLALAPLAKVFFFEGLRDQWINFKDCTNGKWCLPSREQSPYWKGKSSPQRCRLVL